VEWFPDLRSGDFSGRFHRDPGFNNPFGKAVEIPIRINGRGQCTDSSVRVNERLYSGGLYCKSNGSGLFVTVPKMVKGDKIGCEVIAITSHPKQNKKLE
jgi:hypothetical protein